MFSSNPTSKLETFIASALQKAEVHSEKYAFEDALRWLTNGIDAARRISSPQLIKLLIFRAQIYIKLSNLYSADKDCSDAEILNATDIEVKSLRISIDQYSKSRFVGLKLREFDSEQLKNKANETRIIFILEVVYDAIKLINKKQYEQAIWILDGAISLGPLEITLAMRGKCYLEMEKFDLAIQDFEKAIAIQPTSLTYSLKAIAENYLKKYAEAKTSFIKAFTMENMGVVAQGELIVITKNLIECEIGLIAENKISQNKALSPAEQNLFEHLMLTAKPDSLNSELYYQRGNEHLQNMNHAQALEDFQIGCWLKRAQICRSHFSEINFYSALRAVYIALGKYSHAAGWHNELNSLIKHQNILHFIKNGICWLDYQDMLPRMKIKKSFVDQTFVDYALTQSFLVYIKNLVIKAKVDHENQSSLETIKCYYHIIALYKDVNELQNSTLINYISTLIANKALLENHIAQLSQQQELRLLQVLHTIVHELAISSNPPVNTILEAAIAACEKDMFSFINKLSTLFAKSDSDEGIHESISKQIMLAKNLESKKNSSQEDIAKALKVLEDVIPKAIQHKHHLLFAAYITKGRCYLSQKQFEQANIVFQKANLIQATTVTSLYLGLTYAELGQEKAAIDHLVRYMTLEHSNALFDQHERLIAAWIKCEKALDKQISSQASAKKIDLRYVEYPLSSFARGKKEEKQNNDALYTDPDLYFKRAMRYKVNENYQAGLKELVIATWLLKQQNGSPSKVVQFILEKIECYFKLNLIKIAYSEFIELLEAISSLNEQERDQIEGIDPTKVCLRMKCKKDDANYQEQLNKYVILTYVERCREHARQCEKSKNYVFAISYYATAINLFDNIAPNEVKNFDNAMLDFIFNNNHANTFGSQTAEEKMLALKQALTKLVAPFVSEQKTIVNDKPKPKKHETPHSNNNNFNKPPAQKKKSKQNTLSSVLKELNKQQQAADANAAKLLAEQEQLSAEKALQERLQVKANIELLKQQRELAKQTADKERIKKQEKLKKAQEEKEAENLKLAAEKKAKLEKLNADWFAHQAKEKIILQQANGSSRKTEPMKSKIKDFDDEELKPKNADTLTTSLTPVIPERIEAQPLTQPQQTKVDICELPELKEFLVAEEKNKIKGLPYFHYVKRLAQVQRAQGNKCPLTFIVGGLLRNYQLDKKTLPTDIDIVTDASKEQIMTAFTDAKRVKVYEDRAGDIFIIEFHNGTTIEVFRSKKLAETEGTPAERVKADALARDLTINALYADEWGNLYAPLPESLEDILNLNLRTVKDIFDSFSENPIRMLRIITLINQLGINITEPKYENIVNAIFQCADMLLLKEAPFKINGQINKLGGTGNIASTMKMLMNLNVFDALFSLNDGKEYMQATSLVGKNSDWLNDSLLDVDNRTSEGKRNSINKIYMLIIVAMAGNCLDPNIIENNIQNIINANPLFKTNFANFEFLDSLQKNVISNYLTYNYNRISNVQTQTPIMYFNQAASNLSPVENLQVEGQYNNSI